VLDVDERFLTHIAAAGEQFDFAIETVAHDLRDPLPADLQQAFDTIETDPPYTLEGLRLFLARGLEGLRTGSEGDLFLSFAPRDPVGQRGLLAVCVELGLAPLSITPDFNRYVGAATLAHSGQFLHLRATVETARRVEGHYEGPLYTMQGRRVMRRYRCLECGATYKVGPQGHFPTIEILKEEGCARCKGRRFSAGRRIGRD
jgi:predicted methyltransferase